jgi:hypothetical protein
MQRNCKKKKRKEKKKKEKKRYSDTWQCLRPELKPPLLPVGITDQD